MWTWHFPTQKVCLWIQRGHEERQRLFFPSIHPFFWFTRILSTGQALWTLFSWRLCAAHRHCLGVDSSPWLSYHSTFCHPHTHSILKHLFEFRDDDFPLFGALSLTGQLEWVSFSFGLNMHHRDVQRLHYSRKWHDKKRLERMVLFLKMESV